MTHWIVLRVHRLSEGLGVLALKDVVQQILALFLPGVSVWQHLYRTLPRHEERTKSFVTITQDALLLLDQ